ncbi:type IV toxin-antitoxin system AbiEi family antitoxin domain-containing protein [Microlunatus soli]|uniref:Transcriptional regulator, AbiEi antitoxin, Type IV TA system n=1 Tax=Microlunatus soli TaxID=630515 RepID=A0A1H1V771_9ACTN|nr:type IV toxin-antitoxin system AbiEi family antitoxin domain-containing protein [Microlunatus soli]SDS80119.1 Transcriptional regulator, AbiEi antitoxin, Type IV TA system [Microlunatus soli]
MYARYQPSVEVRRLAELQDGVLTREQALGLGVSRHVLQRLVTQGRWQRPLPGVLLTHDQAASWNANAWAGVLHAGAGARLGGYAAAYLGKLVDDPPAKITVLLPHDRGRASCPPWQFVRERSGVRQPGSIGSLPRTTIDDTVLDLASDRFRDGRRQTPVHWVTTAVQRNLTTPARLRRAVNARARLVGRHELMALLADTDAGAESPLEVCYLNDVERAHGLPVGERQVRVDQRGVRRRRDVRYRKYRLLVELDGELGHAGTARFRDFIRDNAALLDGEATLRYGWHDVTQQGCAVALQVAEMLIRGGWTGTPTRCAHCPTGSVRAKG